jgi:beta-phosphoglucomutase-like phosphatase (HAD superfamily)
MGIRAIIFDFNGVLLDDETVHFELFREVLAGEGVTLTEGDYTAHYLGYDDRRCFEAAVLDAGLAVDGQRVDQLIAEKAKRYAERAEQGLRFFPAAAETIAALAARWPVAICSGALRSEIADALRRIDQYESIVAIISAEDTDKCKPDPECYRLALAALQGHARNAQNRGPVESAGRHSPADLSAAECLVIEDSLAGISSAKGAGMWVVALPNTYTAEQLSQAGADEVIDGLRSLNPEWIERRFRSGLVSS